jgi:hypothetical protein
MIIVARGCLIDESFDHLLRDTGPAHLALNTTEDGEGIPIPSRQPDMDFRELDHSLLPLLLPHQQVTYLSHVIN